MNTAETHAAIVRIVSPFGIGTKPRRRNGSAVLTYTASELSDRAGAAAALKAEAARLRGIGQSCDAQSFEIAGALVRPHTNLFPAFA